MTNQRIRNLTTGTLHTSLEHVFEDIKNITGKAIINKRNFLSTIKAMEPYLRKVCTDQKLWEHKYDPKHLGEFEVPPMDSKEQEKFYNTYKISENLW